jgi:hypothetical protein
MINNARQRSTPFPIFLNLREPCYRVRNMATGELPALVAGTEEVVISPFELANWPFLQPLRWRYAEQSRRSGTGLP